MDFLGPFSMSNNNLYPKTWLQHVLLRAEPTRHSPSSQFGQIETVLSLKIVKLPLKKPKTLSMLRKLSFLKGTCRNVICTPTFHDSAHKKASKNPHFVLDIVFSNSKSTFAKCDIACYQNVFENQLFMIICSKKMCSYHSSNIDFHLSSKNSKLVKQLWLFCQAH